MRRVVDSHSIRARVGRLPSTRVCITVVPGYFILTGVTLHHLLHFTTSRMKLDMLGGQLKPKLYRLWYSALRKERTQRSPKHLCITSHLLLNVNASLIDLPIDRALNWQERLPDTRTRDSPSERSQENGVLPVHEVPTLPSKDPPWTNCPPT
jgi:hypothetical protein